MKYSSACLSLQWDNEVLTAFLPCLVMGAVSEHLLQSCQPFAGQYCQVALEGRFENLFFKKNKKLKRGEVLLPPHPVLASLLAALMVTEQQQIEIGW